LLNKNKSKFIDIRIGIDSVDREVKK